MRNIIAIILLLLSLSASAWEAQEDWNSDLEQVLLINCNSDEAVCVSTCGDSYQCRVPAELCRNCVGTGILLSYFYQEVGRWFVNSGEKLTSLQLNGLLKDGKFILLTANSPYNIFTSLNDLKIERNFNSLCPAGYDSFPVVLGALNERREFSSVSAVICHGDNGAEVYRMKPTPNAEIGLRNIFQGVASKGE
jgi:hypothetical protein